MTEIKAVKCPENAGISSQAFLAFIDKMDAENLRWHSVEVLRDGEIAAECYRYPFNADTPHCMYSVSKSITGTALGFAVNEGLLSLDTRLCEVFPEKKLPRNDEYFNSITIRHLITMTAGKSVSPLLNKAKGDWFYHFAQSKRTARPGEKFEYISECTYLVSACICRKSGMSLTDYLTPRLFEPLGIEKPYWETDNNGYEAGGWGLRLKTHELAKIVLCYQQGGVFAGKQVIPAEWAREAVKRQNGSALNIGSDENNGYGYGIWRMNADWWRFDGMYGQYGFCSEKDKLVIAVTSGEVFPEKILGCITEFAQNACVSAAPDAEPDPGFKTALNARVIENHLHSPLRSPLEKTLEGKTIHLPKKLIMNLADFPLGVLPIPAIFMSKDRAGNMDNLVFRFSSDSCTLTWDEGDERNTVICSFTGDYAKSSMLLGQMPFTALGTAMWEDEKTLKLIIRPMEAVASRRLSFTFEGRRVIFKASTNPELSELFSGVLSAIKGAVKNEKLQKLVCAAFAFLIKNAEPEYTGKTKK